MGYTSPGESKSASLPVDPNLLTGVAALAAAASATAYSLQRKEEKEAARKWEEEQSKAAAMAKVQEVEALKTANYIAKTMLEKQLGGSVTSGMVASNLSLQKAYKYIVNSIMGYPQEEEIVENEEYVVYYTEGETPEDKQASIDAHSYVRVSFII